MQQLAEDNEKPCYTDKPSWDAFGAMLLVAACHTYGEPVPPASLAGKRTNRGPDALHRDRGFSLAE